MISILVSLALSSCQTTGREPDQASGQAPVAGTVQFRISEDPSPFKAGSVGGFNVSNAMNLTRIKDRVAAVKPPSFTWPAGNVGDDYEISAQEVGFLKVQQKLLPDAWWFNQVRLYKATLPEALAQIRQSRDLGIRTDVWTIGNEPDLYGPNRGDQTWTPEKYAAVFREWASAIKKEFPGALVSGPAISNPRDEWMEVFIRECGDLVDVLNWHWYPTDGNASDADAMATSSRARAMVEKYRTWLKDPARNPLGWQRSIQTALSEFSIHWNTVNEAQINEITGAAWTADVLGQLAQARLDWSHYFCLQEYGGHAIFNQAHKPRIMYWVFDLWAPLQSASALLDLRPAEPAGLQTAYGWKNADGTLGLIVVNRSDKARPVELLDGLPLPEVRELKVLDAEGMRVGDPAALKVGTIAGGIRLEVPPVSVLRLTLGPR